MCQRIPHGISPPVLEQHMTHTYLRACGPPPPLRCSGSARVPHRSRDRSRFYLPEMDPHGARRQQADTGSPRSPCSNLAPLHGMRQDLSARLNPCCHCPAPRSAQSAVGVGTLLQPPRRSVRPGRQAWGKLSSGDAPTRPPIMRHRYDGAR
jgi:hypothetical protein